MSRKLPKRYVSEDSVKRALKINTFRNVTKDKLMEFASMIPYMDKEVAIAIINQFPVFADFGKAAITSYTQLCNSILDNNKEGQAAAINGYQTILDALSKRMENENITSEECKSITEDMITIADKIAEVHFKNQKFLDRMGTKILCGVIFVSAIIGAGIGINSKFGAGDLPQISDGDDEYTV